ncbi:MAG: beta-galactosidase, partial [Bacteroidia bacterium]
MKKLVILGLSGVLASLNLFAKNPERFFQPKDLTQVGVYYYPEHWDSTQWDRDFQNIAKMGFEFTHFAEFAWAQLEP